MTYCTTQSAYNAQLYFREYPFNAIMPSYTVVRGKYYGRRGRALQFIHVSPQTTPTKSYFIQFVLFLLLAKHFG